MKVAIVLIIAAVGAMAGPTNPPKPISKAVAASAATENHAELETIGTSTPIQGTSESSNAKETTIEGATTSKTAGQEGTHVSSLADALNSDTAEISSGAATEGEAQTVYQEAEGSSIFHHKDSNVTETDEGKPQGRHLLSFLGSGQRNRFGQESIIL